MNQPAGLPYRASNDLDLPLPWASSEVSCDASRCPSNVAISKAVGGKSSGLSGKGHDMDKLSFVLVSGFVRTTAPFSSGTVLFAPPCKLTFVKLCALIVLWDILLVTLVLLILRIIELAELRRT